ncbi:MAG: hypothetical protein A2Y97_03070 [Nitrospirae bacterium RBG_13_39_12]|nr:MAG: hypothetical protein A2Y97_03070 [Nitrospirae bacterium RBG_13_39_12]
MNVLINGINTFYIDTGNPDALPIVFVHGMTLDHKMWQPQIEFFKNKYRVIAYDLRGHGKSEQGDYQYTHRQFADDLIELLNYLNIDHAVLCGLSMGGAVSLRTIEIYPERVYAMILCNTRSDPDSNETIYLRENSIQSIKTKGLKPFSDEFLRSIFSRDSFVKRPEIVRFIQNIILSNKPLSVCGTLLAQAARTDTTPTLSKIKVQVLIISGENDTLTPPDIAKAMHDKISDSQLRIIPDASHISNLENTEEFNKLLLQFLEKLK